MFRLEEYEKFYKSLKEDETIQEVESDSQGRLFKVVNIKDNIKDNYIIELSTLIEWFNTYYTIHEQQYRRLHTLGDNAAYYKLIELYEEAEIKRQKIQQLEVLLND